MFIFSFFSVFLFFFYFFFFFFFFFLYFAFLFFYFLFFIFFSFLWSSEKGTGLSPNLQNQGLARSFLQTPNLLNQGLALSFPPTPNLPNQGSAQFLLRIPNLPGLGVLRKKLAFLRTRNLPNQGYSCSFSELRTCLTRVIPVLSPNSELKLQTLGKNTILDHLVHFQHLIFLIGQLIFIIRILSLTFSNNCFIV